MKLSKKWVLVTGAVVAMAVPTVTAATAHAGSAQIGTPSCYVQVDYLDPNVVIGGTRPPFVTASPSGSVGAGAHCPL